MYLQPNAFDLNAVTFWFESVSFCGSLSLHGCFQAACPQGEKNQGNIEGKVIKYLQQQNHLVLFKDMDGVVLFQ